MRVWEGAGGDGKKGREERRGGSTWLVHTLLKVTKANVCASIVLARSFFASRSGRAIAERNSWGMKARDSSLIEVDGLAMDEER